MSEATEIPNFETQNVETNIRNDNGTFFVSIPEVSLSSEKPPLKFKVTLKKIPTAVQNGSTIDNIKIDDESPKLQLMLAEAQALQGIPERDRPRQLMRILREHVRYAYPDELKSVADSDPDLAKWVIENTGINSSSSKQINLSEVIEKGYGVCRHLSVAMLVLAKAAGLEGSYMTYAPSNIDGKYLAKNVIREDTGDKLFKMTDVGQEIGSHAWVELRTSEGEWIPIDPSTQLVGDNAQGLDTFRKANYRGTVGYSFEAEGFPDYVHYMGNQDLAFLPGEDSHTGVLDINSHPLEKTIIISFTPDDDLADDDEIWPKPTSYEGPLAFTLFSRSTQRGMNISVTNVDQIV